MRNVLIAILGVLACVAITLSTTVVWVHQVALNTDRYVAVVSRVATDPDVVEEVSGRLADRIVDRFDVPRLVKPLLRDWIQGQLGSFMGSDVFLDAWADANRAVHTALLAVLRSDSVLDSSDGQASISVLPVVLVGLQRLQEVGLLPDDLNLPDPRDPGAVEALRETLADRLGIDLPPAFGEVPLVRLSRLETLRQFVTIFDLIAVASVVIAAALVALTIWLARDRRRAIIFLGLGAAVAVLIAVVAIGAISGTIVSALAEDGARSTLAALLDAVLGNLTTALFVILIVGIVAAVAAVAAGRRPMQPPMQPVPIEPVPIEAPAPPPALPVKRTRRRSSVEPPPATPPAKSTRKRST